MTTTTPGAAEIGRGDCTLGKLEERCGATTALCCFGLICGCPSRPLSPLPFAVGLLDFLVMCLGC